MAARWRLLWAEDRTAVLAGSFALLSSLWGLWMAAAIYWWPFRYTSAHNFYYEIDSPVLAIELSRISSNVAAVLQGEQAKAAIWWNTAFDCFLIPMYCGYLFWFALSYGGRTRLCLVLTGSIGLLDAAENFFIFESLGGAAPKQFLVSAAKWVLLSFTAFYIARLLWRSRPGPYSIATRRLLGMLFGGIAALLFVGIAFQAYSWLALGTRLLLLTFVINAVGLVGPIFAIPGHRLEFEEGFCEKQKKQLNASSGIKEIPEAPEANGSSIQSGA